MGTSSSPYVVRGAVEIFEVDYDCVAGENLNFCHSKRSVRRIVKVNQDTFQYTAGNLCCPAFLLPCTSDNLENYSS